MAECRFCKQEMKTATSCFGNAQQQIKGEIYDSIPWDPEFPPDTKCGDCGVSPQGFHHPGCDVERCPVCPGSCIGLFVPYGDGKGYDHDSTPANANGPGYPPFAYDYIKGCQINSLGRSGKHLPTCTFQHHPKFRWWGQQAIGCGCKAKPLPEPFTRKKLVGFPKK